MLFYHNRGTSVWPGCFSILPILARRNFRAGQASLSLRICYSGRTPGAVNFGLGGTIMAGTIKKYRLKATSTILLLAIIAATPAHAFRCGSKIVIENMHEQQVRRACGEPTSVRHLGYTLRGVDLHARRGLSNPRSTRAYSHYGYYTEEVVVTEYVYNFGPRKFMRLLRFEGSILVSIETIGYGYRDRIK